MVTKKRDRQGEEVKQLVCEALTTLIGEQVIQDLGRPGDLLRVQVRPLWANHYRANILVGVGITSARVAHSFFLTVDIDGAIIASSPKMARLY